MPETIREVRWEELLPQELQQDRSIAAMVGAIAEEKRRIAEALRRCVIWPGFEDLSEQLMEILRQDLDIPAHVFTGTPEERQRMLSMARAMQRSAGTKAAVRQAIVTVYPEGRGDVQEWYEYGGEPYYYRPVIDVTGQDVDLDRLTLCLQRILQAANVRSWIDIIKLVTHGTSEGRVYTGGVIMRSRAVTIFGINGLVEDVAFLLDEDQMMLTDENGDILCEY